MPSKRAQRSAGYGGPDAGEHAGAAPQPHTAPAPLGELACIPHAVERNLGLPGKHVRHFSINVGVTNAAARVRPDGHAVEHRLLSSHTQPSLLWGGVQSGHADVGGSRGGRPSTRAAPRLRVVHVMMPRTLQPAKRHDFTLVAATSGGAPQGQLRRSAQPSRRC